MSGLAAAGCAVGFPTVRLTSGYGSLVQLGADVVVTALVYLLAWVAFRTVRRDVADVVELVSLMRRRPAAA
jgi:hypothetical protein